MSPGEHLEGLAGHQRIVMHAGAEQVQPTLAAQSIVGRQEDGTVGTETAHEKSSENLAQSIERPGVMGKEAVVAGPVSDAHLSGGENAFGDEAVPRSKSPAGENENEQAERGAGENAGEVL